MSYETIEYDIAERVATLSFSRPEKLNAFNRKLRDEFLDVMDRVDGDDGVRALIVTGSGRAFCAGADLSDGAKSFEYTKDVVRPDGSLDYTTEAARDGGGIMALRLFECLKPVIAAVNGPAVGIGATITLPMDIRIASDAAKFGFVFARRGIVPEAASSFFLPRLVGVPQALEWCYSGEVFGAAEALRGGLVSSVHAPDELMPAARSIARKFIEHTAPVSVALIRQMMWRGLGMTHPIEAHCIDSRGILSRGRSRDATEGVNSFLEKRAPSFPDQVSKDMPDYFPWWTTPPYA